MQRHRHDAGGQFPTASAMLARQQLTENPREHPLAAELHRPNEVIHGIRVLKKEQRSYYSCAPGAQARPCLVADDRKKRGTHVAEVDIGPDIRRLPPGATQAAD